MPARTLVRGGRKDGTRLCGVCAHRVIVLRDLTKRLIEWRNDHD